MQRKNPKELELEERAKRLDEAISNKNKKEFDKVVAEIAEAQKKLQDEYGKIVSKSSASEKNAKDVGQLLTQYGQLVTTARQALERKVFETVYASIPRNPSEEQPAKMPPQQPMTAKPHYTQLPKPPQAEAQNDNQAPTPIQGASTKQMLQRTKKGGALNVPTQFLNKGPAPAPQKQQYGTIAPNEPKEVNPYGGLPVHEEKQPQPKSTQENKVTYVKGIPVSPQQDPEQKGPEYGGLPTDINNAPVETKTAQQTNDQSKKRLNPRMITAALPTAAQHRQYGRLPPIDLDKIQSNQQPSFTTPFKDENDEQAYSSLPIAEVKTTAENQNTEPEKKEDKVIKETTRPNPRLNFSLHKPLQQTASAQTDSKKGQDLNVQTDNKQKGPRG